MLPLSAKSALWVDDALLSLALRQDRDYPFARSRGILLEFPVGYEPVNDHVTNLFHSSHWRVPARWDKDKRDEYCGGVRCQLGR